MKKLFVSSTFKDMQLERDSLKKHIIPNLNLKLREYGTKISQTDLRWGISTSELSAEESEQKILNVCLEEINKSRPYMIVMIGERYGWIPSPAIIEMNARGRDIRLESNDISVTQLEIEYIAFMEKWDESRIFFYFRDLDTSNMDEAARDIYASESPEAKAKLLKLKKRIESKFPDQIRHYTLEYKDGSLSGIEDFERLVSEDLYSLFCRDLRDGATINVNERLKEKLHAEALESLGIYVPQYDIRSPASQSDVPQIERMHCYVYGPPRSGKTLSVSARYSALYAFTHRSLACWELAKPHFDAPDFPHYGGGRFHGWLDGIDLKKLFPLYLQMGNSKDILDDVAFLRTFLYFLNKHLGIIRSIPSEREELIFELTGSLTALAHSDKTFYLFLDDMTPEVLGDLFEIENRLNEEDIASLIKHLFFFITLSNDFSSIPAYMPFYKYTWSTEIDDQIYFADEYLYAYARKLGKELSPGVVKYIHAYYGYCTSEEKPADAELTHIVRPQASLMANYAMNFTAEDYQAIKAAGNDMAAIEARQLQLLRAVKSNFNDDYHGRTLKKIALLNISKFAANHSEATMRALGAIYILSGVTFSMEEAEYIYERLGYKWSDLEFISYFDDFREFFLYDADADSYKILPTFQGLLREYFIDEYLKEEGVLEAAVSSLIAAVKDSPFYEIKREELIVPVLLVPNTEFVYKTLEALNTKGDEYLFGKTVGENTIQLISTLTTEYTQTIAKTVAQIVTAKSTDFTCGFFDGLDCTFQGVESEKRVLELAQVLAEAECKHNATYKTRIALLRSYCYIGWKNDKAIEHLLEAEPYIAASDKETRVKIISVLSGFLPKFKADSTLFIRISNIIQRNLPKVERLPELDERSLLYHGDIYRLAAFVDRYSLCDSFYDPESVLKPLIARDRFAKIGLFNAETAINMQDARDIGMDALVKRTEIFMESLATSFSRFTPSVSILISKCMLNRFVNATRLVPKENYATELEKYFYPYKKAINSFSGSFGRFFINYSTFLHNALYFHENTGITHQYDEILWEATKMGNWITVFDSMEESIDLIIEVCWAYITYIQRPNFHDMMSDNATKSYMAARLMEEGSENPSPRALQYRLTVQLSAVLHNPSTRIMKPKLKRLFKTVYDQHREYLDSLNSSHLKTVMEFIEGL